MKYKGIIGLLVSFACGVCMVGALAGCNAASSSSNQEHEAITIETAFRNIAGLEDMVKEKYPEINLDIIPYSGANYTAYAKAELAADDLPDIYCPTVYNPSRDDVSGKLIDLSSYDFTDNYVESRIQDVASDDGSVYMLPTYYSCIGITYNKTLLKKHGWKLPTSFKELEALAKKAKKAGVNLCLTQVQLPGYGFQDICNILDTCFLNTPEGRTWQNDYLDGKTNVSNSKDMLEAMNTLDKWRDLGMLNDKGDPQDDTKTREEMGKGNTLFMIGTANTFKEGESKCEFGLMPYLSENGDHNAFILNVSRYIGLNKHLQDKGNEQKLEDALHVMEVISSVEGMSELNKAMIDTSLLPLKDYRPSKSNYYADVIDEINEGQTAPFIYSGWDNVIVPIGQEALKYFRGESSLDKVIKTFDDSQPLLEDNGENTFTTVTEKFNTDECAKLVGVSFAKATGTDCALISKNKYYRYDQQKDLNLEGVSGNLFPLPVTDQELTSIVPTGWAQNIQVGTLTGKRIKELAETGYDRDGVGDTYPYEFVVPEGVELQDDKTYKFAIAGVTDAVAKEGKVKDSGILGLTAAQDYVKQFDTLAPSDVVWTADEGK